LALVAPAGWLIRPQVRLSFSTQLSRGCGGGIE
jgi:hypothetical protein